MAVVLHGLGYKNGYTAESTAALPDCSAAAVGRGWAITYPPNLNWKGRDDSERLEDFVVEIVSRREETGWTVARLQPGAAEPVRGPGMQMVRVVSVLPNLTAGQILKPDGRWRRHRDMAGSS